MSSTTTINTNKRRAKTPSFSSILLDAIYRSIDDDGDGDTITNSTPPTAITTPCNSNHHYHNKNDDHYGYAKQRRSKMRSDSTLETVDLRRAIMIESWMEKQPQKSDDHDHDHCNILNDHQKIHMLRQKSVPSIRSRSSDNSFSSKLRANLAPRAAESCFRFDQAPPPAKRVSSSRIFTKTKSRAMKFYGELKKPKQSSHHHQQQPISPGGRIAAFLNSIFRNSGGSPANRSHAPPSATSTSTCSSASSFSRSCLSKTPSSRGKSSTSTSSTTTKRSVRFYPVSVIVDEDSRPCGHKSLLREEDNDILPKPPLISSTRNVNEINVNENVNEKRQINNNSNSQRKLRREKEIDALMMMIKRNCQEQTVSSFNCDDSDVEMNDDNDGGESCASSDLFELENLSSIGVSRYSEELPVYGTTSLEKLTA